MIQINVTRNLIGLEDLLTGVGTVEQVRGAGDDTVTITKLNAQNFPYNDTITLDEKLQELEDLANSLSVVDGDGVFLTGYLNTSDSALNLAGRMWRKTPSADVAELYYGTVRVLQYNRVTGDIIIPPDTDYIAADIVVVDDLTAYVDGEIVTVNSTITALDNSLGTAATLDVGTTANKVVQLTAAAKLPAVDGSLLTNISGVVPIGAIIVTAANTPDTNYLECNGAEVSRSTYATLFSRIGTTFGVGDGSTTFNLPDIRGEFVRGWDNSRGVDSGRAFGSLQADALKAHTHQIKQVTNNTIGGSNTGAHASSGTYTSGTSSTGGTETRPRSIALMYQIKAL